MSNHDFDVDSIALKGSGTLNEFDDAQQPGPQPFRKPSDLSPKIDPTGIRFQGKGVGGMELGAPDHVERVARSNKVDDPMAFRVVDDRGGEVPDGRKMHRALPDVKRPPVGEPTGDHLESGRNLKAGIWNQDMEPAKQAKEWSEPAGPMPNMMKDTLEHHSGRIVNGMKELRPKSGRDGGIDSAENRVQR